MSKAQRLSHDMEWAMHAMRTHRAVLILDLAGRIVAVNQSYLRMCGYRREELVGRPVVILLDPLEKGANRLCRVLETPDGGEARIPGLAQRTKAGRRFRVDARICPIRDDEGEICLNVLFLREPVEEEGPLRAALPLMQATLAKVIALPVAAASGGWAVPSGARLGHGATPITAARRDH